MDRAALDAAYAAASRYLEGLHARPVGAAADAAAMRTALAGPLPEQGEPAARIVEELARKADPGIVASGGARFLGFVIGGLIPVAPVAAGVAPFRALYARPIPLPAHFGHLGRRVLG